MRDERCTRNTCVASEWVNGKGVSHTSHCLKGAKGGTDAGGPALFPSATSSCPKAPPQGHRRPWDGAPQSSAPGRLLATTGCHMKRSEVEKRNSIQPWR